MSPASCAGEHVPAVPHDRDPLADREDLLEPVRDEQHRGALGAQRARSTSKSRSTSAADSAAVGSSITITRASRDSALPISTTCWSAMDRPRAIRAGSSGTPSRLKISRPPRRASPAGRSAARPQRLAPDEHVLRHGEVGEQRRLLVDDGDAGRPGRGRAVQRDLPAGHVERPAVRLVHPGEDLDERRLARAVLADQRVHLAGAQLDRAVDQGADRAERLGGVPQREHRLAVAGSRLRAWLAVRGVQPGAPPWAGISSCDWNVSTFPVVSAWPRSVSIRLPPPETESLHARGPRRIAAAGR